MIALGCDHGGYELKEELKRYLDEIGIKYKDFGTHSKERTDYPIYAEQVAKAVGIVIKYNKRYQPLYVSASINGATPKTSRNAQNIIIKNTLIKHSTNSSINCFIFSPF